MSDHLVRIETILKHLKTSSSDLKKKKRRRRIGFVGFGKVGKFLLEKTMKHPDLEVAFICDLFNPNAVRSYKGCPEECKIYDTKDIPRTRPVYFLLSLSLSLFPSLITHILLCRRILYAKWLIQTSRNNTESFFSRSVIT